MFIKKLLVFVEDLLAGEGDPQDVIYDPTHVAGLVVSCVVAMGLIYWLLWSFMVCEGGIFIKAGALGQVLLTSKTLADFGYEGYPYQMGLFEGWIVNVVGFTLFVVVVVSLWWVFQTTDPKKKATRSPS